VLVVDFSWIVFQAVPHSLASHHHVWHGPESRLEVLVPPSESALEPSASMSPVGMFYPNGSPVFYPSGRVVEESEESVELPLLLRAGLDVVADEFGGVGSVSADPHTYPLLSRARRQVVAQRRGRQAEANSSMGCLRVTGLSAVAEADVAPAVSMLSSPSGSYARPLRAGMDVVAGRVERGRESVGAVAGPVSASPHPYPLRSRSRGPYLRDLEEEVDEPTFYISSHARRSLAVQEAWKKVRDKKRRKRGEDEDAELDDEAEEGCDRSGPGSQGRRGGGDDEEGPGGVGGMAV